MKVLLVNGSPHEKGCTYTALQEVSGALTSEGIDTEFFWIGKQPIAGCAACGACKKLGRCVYDDQVNTFLDLAKGFDGFVFGSPVHWASAGGAISCLLDRAFFVDSCADLHLFRLKPAAVLVSARRAGTTAALDQLMKYPAHAEMPIITSRYWNMVHGSNPDDVRKDLEGLQIMRAIGKDMAFFLKCIKAGLDSGLVPPAEEPRAVTNFIR